MHFLYATLQLHNQRLTLPSRNTATNILPPLFCQRNQREILVEKEQIWKRRYIYGEVYEKSSAKLFLHSIPSAEPWHLHLIEWSSHWNFSICWFDLNKVIKQLCCWPSIQTYMDIVCSVQIHVQNSLYIQPFMHSYVEDLLLVFLPECPWLYILCLLQYLYSVTSSVLEQLQMLWLLLSIVVHCIYMRGVKCCVYVGVCVHAVPHGCFYAHVLFDAN